jgi:hypothetical protein
MTKSWLKNIIGNAARMSADFAQIKKGLKIVF